MGNSKGIRIICLLIVDTIVNVHDLTYLLSFSFLIILDYYSLRCFIDRSIRSKDITYS